jgi:hypothetical protein
MKNNVPVGRPAANAQELAELVKQGFTFFQGPGDLALMATGARPLLQSLGKSGIDPKLQPLY